MVPELNENSTLNLLIVKGEVFDTLVKEGKSRKLRIIDVKNDKDSILIGTIHNLFAMVIMQKIMPRSIMVPVFITLAIYYTEYFMYYFITLKYAKDMIID